MTIMHKAGWGGLAILCAIAFGHVVGFLNPHEKVNGLWLVVAASCFYVLAYRFYGRFLARRVMELDDSRRTPAYRLEDGTNFYPANKYILFGHHFAAIAGAGPLLGPVLASQFGFLPGFLWIVIGAVLAGAVQDFIILVASMRRNGRSLPEIAHAELGPITGLATAIAVLFIVIVALAGLGLAVVNALYDNAWGTFTIVMTIPIAFIMGLYLQKFRPGQVGEMTLLGLALLIFTIIFGRIVAQSEWAEWFLWDRTTLTWCLATYGFLASVLPRVDPLGPSRLFVNLHEIRCDCLTRSRGHFASTHHRNAPNNRVYKRKRPNHSRYTFPISLYHDRMWCYIRVSFPCIIRYDPKAHQPGIPSYCGIWCHALRKFRGRNCSHRRVPIDSR